MIRTGTRVMIYFLVFVLLQVLVVNNIRLFGIVTPFIYIYVLLKMPIDMSRTSEIAISFLLGFAIDLFSNTYGMHAAACSFIGFIRTPILERFVDMKDLPDGSIPSYRLFGFGKFIRFVLLMVTLHHIALFLIESFSLFQPWRMMVRMSLSIVLSFLLILVLEAFNLGKRKSGE